MAEINNNNWVDLIFARARALGGANSTLVTAERFIVALIDMIDNGTLSDENLVKSVDLLFEAAKCDKVTAKRELLGYINEGKGASYLDDLYMKKKIDKTKADAKNIGIDFVSTELLLGNILLDPTEAIASCFSSEQKSETEILSGSSNTEAKSMEPIRPVWEMPYETDEKAPDEKKPEKKDDSKTKITDLTQKVKEMQAELSQRIFGQDNAINIFATGYFQAELLSMTDKKRTRPGATFLFAGPPGVGKTFLAESVAEILGLPFKRFDMSEYADDEAIVEFCGSDNVYKNGKVGNVTDFVAHNPKCVILFDEIEKAHLVVIHLFLQMLDAGRLRDNYTDKEVSFKDAILIFTTNAGKQFYENTENGDFSNVSRKVILKALQKDINPTTGVPYFPAAICSRFASGNVVMFNHISAHNLYNIAKREVLRHAKNFESEFGVKIEIDEKVYSALLFAEGGAADARTVRARAESFLDNELYELFRLTSSEASETKIGDIEKIEIGVDLPYDDRELMALFESREKPKALVFSSDDTAKLCEQGSCECEFLKANDFADAKKLLEENDLNIVLIDPNYGMKEDASAYLNMEDVESKARDFFKYVREYHTELPVYLLETGEHTFNPEERTSFLRQGVRGIVSLCSDSFFDDMSVICQSIHQQQSMQALAKANKLVTFETAQTLEDGGKIAKIRLLDFDSELALDPDDSKNVLSDVSKPNIKFDEIIGAQDAKKELKYFADYLKNPKKYRGTGVRVPRGILLYGPPGTGKTMLAKAMASESDVTFISAEGNQFLKKYVGEGPEKVHELFNVARKYAPAILFVDEIDAIAKERTGSEYSRQNEEILTAFLTEMDGFKNDPTKPVFVMAATNFNVEPGSSKSLDPALMRRFDRRVYIDLPNRDDRVRYMKMKISRNSAFVISDEKIDNIAIRSTGMSLASLESVFELALRTVLRDGGVKVTDEVLEEAFETFNSGEKKTWDISQLERVARHEAGHAFLCWHSGETPSYLTVVARANHGGYMQHGDNEGKAIYTKDELLTRIRTALGGRASEIVYYGERDGISTGASGDLASATHIAQRIICTYGMDESFGLAVIDPQSANMGELSDDVRAAVNKILASEMENAIRLIEENRVRIDALVEVLMSKNHLTGSEINEILSKNP